jgi:hypothetical protein
LANFHYQQERENRKGIIELLKRKGLDVSKLRILGGDSTSVNTGRFVGAISMVEQLLKRRLYRYICTLHLNELELRHDALYFIGPTSSPDSFKSNLGKAIKNLRNPVIASFPPIPNSNFPTLEEKIITHLSHDQKLLYLGCWAVMCGNCPPDLASRTFGLRNHSRWVTFAPYIIFHDMTYEHSPYFIACLAYFVIHCYANMCFRIKIRPKATEAARLTWESMGFLIQLPEEERAIVLPIFERGLYWAHPANLLLCMLGDEGPAVRKETVYKVMCLRHSPPQPQPSTLSRRACGSHFKRRASGTQVIPTLPALKASL